MGAWVGGRWYPSDDVPQHTCPHCSSIRVSFTRVGNNEPAIQCETCGCLKKASDELNDMGSWTREWTTKKWDYVLEDFIRELKRTCEQESYNKSISLQENFAYATIVELIKDWMETHPRKNYL